MRGRLLRVWVLCWLMLVWVLLWGTVTPANIIGGFAVALVITLMLPLPAVPVEGRLHPLSLLRLAAVVGYQLVMSSIQVAWLAVKPGPPPLTAVLRAQLSIKSDLVLALAANILTIIPGSMALEIDQERRLLYMHVIDVGSDKAVDRFYRQVAQIERLLIAAFERETEFQQASTRTSSAGIPFRGEEGEP
jgi:multicomponent Na+:H+ antiporter subunit E